MNVSSSRLPRLLVCVVALSLGAGRTSAGVNEGQATFATMKCITCHKLNGKAGAQYKLLHGPILDHIASKPGHDRAWFQQYLKDPNSRIPNARMPKVDLTEKQIGDLADYLVTLK